ncbi:hypothetical protein BV898_10743 [Hypsibius exemplaris]|uniref:Tetraspanin n=1 Tax=Hypsibius exemplaris TaxID=2072580 RepID=A0A1W0WJ07_HYPEX|nr:hypothetical protein BV898_10743 [Hypsibius exemplaris]
MGTRGVQCVRVCFIVLNIVVSLFACAGLGLGIWLQIHTTATARFLLQYATISVAELMIAVGCIGILICIMGCCGSWALSKILLMLYFLAVLVIFLAEIGLAIYFLIFRDTMTDNFRYEQKLGIRTNYLPHSTLSKIWDAVQEDFGCCGMDSPADWHYIAAWPELAIAPDSCCIPEARRMPNCGKSLDFRSIYPRGCFEVIRDFVTRNMYIFAIAAVALALIQLLGLIFSMVLFCARREVQDDKLIIVATKEEPDFVEVREVREIRRDIEQGPPVVIRPAYVETNL